MSWDPDDGFLGAGGGVGEAPGRVAKHLPELDAVGDAADATGDKSGDVAVAHRALDHGLQVVAHLDVLPPTGVVAADFLVEHGVGDGFDFLTGVLVGFEGIFLVFPGGGAFGADLPAPGLGDGLAALVVVVGDAGLDEDFAGELAFLLLQAGELFLTEILSSR